MRIVIVGSGTVGQATGLGMLDMGHDVTFIDINIDLIRRLSTRGYEARLPQEVGKEQVDFMMVCISTPPRVGNGAVNLDYIQEGMATVGRLLAWQNGWPIVIIRSTVPPGTTDSQMIPLMEKFSGKKVGVDFGACFNPEFLRAKSSTEDFRHPWATVIGELNKRSGDILEKLYQPFGGKLFRMTILEAELVKYIHNLRNAMVISFNNEMWLLARKLLGIDANCALEVVTHTAESAWNPQYGSKGGYPYGGSCLPKDTTALIRFAEERGMDMPLLAAVVAVNEVMNELAAAGEVQLAQIAGHRWRQSPGITKPKEETG